MADTTTADAFADKVFTSLIGAFDTAMIHLGHRLGLYRSLADSGPSTPSQLARTAGLDERYVREWLEQQTTAGNLTCPNPDAGPGERTFELPEAHRIVLTETLSDAYMAPFPDFFMALARNSDQLPEVFRTGGGISWQRQGKGAREAQGDANRALFLNHLGQTYLAAAPEARERLEAGGRVAELGCGMGWAAIGVALAYPQVSVVGYDVDLPSVEAARLNAAAQGVGDRVEFVCVDATGGIEDGDFDLVLALECVHDLGDPVGFLRTMKGLAGDDGVVIVMDERVADTFTAGQDPVEQMYYGFSLMCCLPDGKEHENSAETGTVMRAPTLNRYAIDAGYHRVEVLDDLEHDFFRFYRLHQGAG